MATSFLYIVRGVRPSFPIDYHTASALILCILYFVYMANLGSQRNVPSYKLSIDKIVHHNNVLGDSFMTSKSDLL